MRKLTLFITLLLLGSLAAFAQNTKFGSYALSSNTNGFENSAFGYESLRYNTSGYENSAFGVEALKFNIDGNDNSAFGKGSLRNNTFGNSNSAFGNRALNYNTTGGGNTGIGTWALINNTSGSSNTAVGGAALWYNQTGNNNTAVGEWCLAGIYTPNSASNNSALGYRSLMTNRGNDNNAFGYYALASNTTGGGNAAFGTNALTSNLIGAFNAAFGNNSLNKNTASYNSAFGIGAAFSNISGTYNSALGYNSLYFNQSGNNNTAVGDFALRYARYSNNVGLGMYAGNDSDYDSDCTFIGYNTNNDSYLHLYNNSTAIGSGARLTASNQVAVGNSSVTSIGGFAGWTNFSDGRFKKEVNEDVPGLEFIKKLRPVTYHLDVKGLAEYLHEDVTDMHEGRKQAAGEAAIQARNDKGKQLETGFIAQEVEAAAKELGYDFSGVDKPQNETDLYGLRYAAFTVPLVKAVQELDRENASIRQENAELKRQNLEILQRLEALEKHLSGRNSRFDLPENTPSLQQNVPNPFNQGTDIQCFVPTSAMRASLHITNETGLTIKDMHITERGTLSLHLSTDNLSAGTYFYTLIIDNKKIETKKMILINNK